MVKEYINELLSENKEKLEKLDKRMKELLNDLDCAKKWLDTMYSETNTDKNIFSPRAIDTELDKKTKDAQDNIEKIRQEIDYTRSFIEENVKKKLEYEKLLEEVEHMELNKGMNDFTNFLSDLYKKTELCLSCLYDDRTKCKNELKNMKSMIQNSLDLFSEQM